MSLFEFHDFFICICRDSFEIEIEDFSSQLETVDDDDEEEEYPGSIQVKEETDT